MNDNDCSRSSGTLDTIRQDVDTETSTSCGISHHQLLEKEAEFAQQRAKFMELFRQKEDELRVTREQLTEADKERSTLRQRLNELTSEVDDVKTAAAILQVGKDDEIAVAQRQYREELASFQQIMDEAVSQAQQSATAKYEAERIEWLKHQQHLETELQDLRNKLSQDREGFLTSITKTLQKRVAVVAGQSRDEQDNLEYSMKKAQEDAELLRSVVSPLEEEINSLKVQLREARERSAQPVVKAESPCPTLPPADVESSLVCDKVDGKVRELNMSLQTEKASRTDLEMYVAVLNTQKKALGDEMDKLRTQLQEVCQLLEREKLDHSSLKRTWQMANDQFLESQRLVMADLRRMESLLTADQRVQLAELKSKEVKVEAATKAVNEESSEQTKAESESRGELNESKDSAATAQSTVDINSANVNVSTSAENADSSTLNSSLTEAQQRSLLDPTPESEQSRTLVTTALCKVASLPLEQKRIVSETEWEMLQKEVRDTRERIGRVCSSCSGYESQLQSAREGERDAFAQLRAVERQLELERQAMDKQQRYTAELETSLQTVSEQTESQITTLANKQRESERFLSGVKQQLVQAQQDLYTDLQRLTENREEIQAELTRLQEDNNSLIGKHSKHSQEMQDEAIDLPNTVEEMQLLVLKYREDLITAKVGQEHNEELLRSEIMFLRDQLVAEQQERSTMEENLAQEISGLQQELVLRNSLGTELEREKQVRSDAETKQKDLEMSETQLKQTITDLQTQVQGLEAARSKYESDIHLLRLKVSSLQTDLENSEAVQRDFVKLSQSLQIQLEKIRASENEVRWQHEDDIDDCSNCKLTFGVTRRKHHCRHCGQIFCNDCLGKTVNSGPHQRPARVCDVCHTILVPDATPYFCSETLHTPN